MTLIIVPIEGNEYRYQTVDGTNQGRPFQARHKAEFLAQLERFRRTLPTSHTPTSAVTAAFIAARPTR